MPKSARTRAPSGPLEETSKLDDNISSKYKSSLSSLSAESYDDKKEESKIGRFGHEKGKPSTDSVASMPKLNEGDFLATYQQNTQP